MTNQTEVNKEKTIFACNIGAMNAEQRARYAALVGRFFNDKNKILELADGYAVSAAADSQTIKDAAEFIAYERLCCPFLDFELEVKGENLSLRLKGAEGVKEFLRAELHI